MQISPISQSQIQSKPSFEGTVHKSVIKFIDDAVRQEMSDIVKENNFWTMLKNLLQLLKLQEE